MSIVEDFKDIKERLNDLQGEQKAATNNPAYSKEDVSRILKAWAEALAKEVPPDDQADPYYVEHNYILPPFIGCESDLDIYDSAVHDMVEEDSNHIFWTWRVLPELPYDVYEEKTSSPKITIKEYD